MVYVVLPHRFPVWVALSLFSFISMLSLLDERDQNWYFEAKWSIALASISFGLSFLVCVVQLVKDARDRFVATKVEGVVILILAIVWCLAIPVIMAPGNGLAMFDTRIVDANLYFSSWAAFGSALFLFASYGHGAGNLAAVFASRWWVCLFVSSCITLTAALRLKSKLPVCRGTGKREQCGELRLGIALSALSAAISAGLVLLGYRNTCSNVSDMLGLAASIIALTVWSVCVAYLTFDNGPGSNVGNLFFGTWVSFVLALYLVLSHMQIAMSTVASTSSTANTTTGRTSSTPSAEPKEKKKVKKSKATEQALPK